MTTSHLDDAAEAILRAALSGGDDPLAGGVRDFIDATLELYDQPDEQPRQYARGPAPFPITPEVEGEGEGTIPIAYILDRLAAGELDRAGYSRELALGRRMAALMYAAWERGGQVGTSKRGQPIYRWTSPGQRPREQTIEPGTRKGAGQGGQPGEAPAKAPKPDKAQALESVVGGLKSLNRDEITEQHVAAFTQQLLGLTKDQIAEARTALGLDGVRGLKSGAKGEQIRKLLDHLRGGGKGQPAGAAEGAEGQQTAAKPKKGGKSRDLGDLPQKVAAIVAGEAPKLGREESDALMQRLLTLHKDDARALAEAVGERAARSIADTAKRIRDRLTAADEADGGAGGQAPAEQPQAAEPAAAEAPAGQQSAPAKPPVTAATVADKVRELAGPDNLVPVGKLARALGIEPGDREGIAALHKALQEGRAGPLTMSQVEGRHGLDPQEAPYLMKDGGEDMGYVSLKEGGQGGQKPARPSAPAQQPAPQGASPGGQPRVPPKHRVGPLDDSIIRDSLGELLGQVQNETARENGHVSIATLRQKVREKYGPEAASPQVFDRLLMEMRYDKQLRLIPASDLSALTDEDHRGAIPGMNELFATVAFSHPTYDEAGNESYRPDQYQPPAAQGQQPAAQPAPKPQAPAQAAPQQPAQEGVDLGGSDAGRHQPSRGVAGGVESAARTAIASGLLDPSQAGRLTEPGATTRTKLDALASVDTTVFDRIGQSSDPRVRKHMPAHNEFLRVAHKLYGSLEDGARRTGGRPSPGAVANYVESLENMKGRLAGVSANLRALASSGAVVKDVLGRPINMGAAADFYGKAVPALFDEMIAEAQADPQQPATQPSNKRVIPALDRARQGQQGDRPAPTRDSLVKQWKQLRQQVGDGPIDPYAARSLNRVARTLNQIHRGEIPPERQAAAMKQLQAELDDTQQSLGRPGEPAKDKGQQAQPTPAAQPAPAKPQAPAAKAEPVAAGFSGPEAAQAVHLRDVVGRAAQALDPRRLPPNAPPQERADAARKHEAVRKAHETLGRVVSGELTGEEAREAVAQAIRAANEAAGPAKPQQQTQPQQQPQQQAPGRGGLDPAQARQASQVRDMVGAALEEFEKDGSPYTEPHRRALRQLAGALDQAIDGRMSPQEAQAAVHRAVQELNRMAGGTQPAAPPKPAPPQPAPAPQAAPKPAAAPAPAPAPAPQPAQRPVQPAQQPARPAQPAPRHKLDRRVRQQADDASALMGRLERALGDPKNRHLAGLRQTVREAGEVLAKLDRGEYPPERQAAMLRVVRDRLDGVYDKMSASGASF